MLSVKVCGCPLPKSLALSLRGRWQCSGLALRLVGLRGLARAVPDVPPAWLLPLALHSLRPSVRMLLSVLISGDQTETAKSVHLFGIILTLLFFSE